ncbi:MAG: NAD(P)/FAD-dependent oxidoreductase [Bacillota bacterium]
MAQVRVIVVGGGAAGMMAAGRAAQKNGQVILLEKNKMLGKKILISGKGRCNITNNTDIDGLLNNFPGNSRFLRGPFHTFSNIDLMNFFENYGVKLKVERGGRVFPESDDSANVIKALERYMQEGNVDIQTQANVREVYVQEGGSFKVALENGKVYISDKLIITTGGLSYPKTGSTGDGQKWAKKLGHSIVPMRPSLVPLVTKENWIQELQGLSLKNVKVEIATKEKKKLAEDFGEMLFTHFGVSGPIILTVSRAVVDHFQQKKEPLFLHLDLKPALTEKQLDARLQRDIQQFTNKQLKNSLGQLLPSKLIPVIIKRANIEAEKVMHQITKEERKELVSLLKDFTLTIEGARPVEEAIVTAGGIDVKEINPKTMESKLIPNLFFAGEVLDIDGYTGGFNLQAAFSTGYLAGQAAADDH